MADQADDPTLRVKFDTSAFLSGSARMQGEIAKISGSFDRLNGLVSRFNSAFALLGVGLSVNKIIQVNTEFERLAAQLETVTGSSQAAKVAFDALTDFAAKTPFSLAETTEAFTQLKARGLDPSLESLQGYANIAAGFGRSIGDSVRAVGAAVLGETEPLKSFGIQAVTAGDKMIFTFQGLQTTVARTAESIEKYLVGIGKTNFAGATERQLQTLGGAFSNLEDNLQTTIYALGQGGFNDALKFAVVSLSDGIQSTKGFATELGKLAGTAITQTVIALKSMSAELLAVGGGFAALLAAFATMRTFGAVFSAIGAVIAALSAPVTATVAAFAALVAGVIYFRDTTISLGGEPVRVLDIVDAAVNNISRDMLGFLEAVKGPFNWLLESFKELAASMSAVYDRMKAAMELGRTRGNGRGGTYTRTPSSDAAAAAGPTLGETIAAQAREAAARRNAVEYQSSLTNFRQSELTSQQTYRDPFLANAQTGASPMAVQVAEELRKQLISAGLIGRTQAIAQSVGQTGIALSAEQIRAFANGGRTPTATSTGDALKPGEIQVLNDIRARQNELIAKQIELEYKQRDASIKGQDEITAAYGKGTRAVEEAQARAEAYNAVAKDGRDLQTEYAKQLAEADAKRREQAASTLNDAQFQLTAQQRLADAAKQGNAALAEQQIINEALAASAKNSALSYEDYLRILRETKRLAVEQAFAVQINNLHEQAEAAKGATIRLNELTLQYEVYSRELLVVQKVQEMMASDKSIDPARAREMAEALVDAQDAMRKIDQQNEAMRQRVEANDWTVGARRGLKAYQDSALNMARNVENLVVNTFQSMEDALVQFVKTGKLDFKSLADSIISDLIRIQIRMMLMNAIQAAGGSLSFLGGLFGSGGAAAGAAGAAGSAGTVSTMSSAVIAIARGAVFDQGNIVPFRKGGVNYAPQYFPMANGNVGVWGEAGPEAIMPLGRDSSGRLGIRSNGGGGGYTTVLNIDARGSQVGVERLIRQVIAQEEPAMRNRAVRQSINAVTGEADRGGRFSKAVGRR